jgi:hypothetical protein
MGVAQHAAQKADLQIAQRAWRPALGLAHRAQEADGRPAPRGLERREQRLGQQRPVEIDHRTITLT